MTQVKRHSDTEQREILENAKVIAVVGYSDNPSRTSYQIAKYLKNVGYKVYAVNPTIESVDGEKAYPTLADVPEKIDIVDVFRRSEFLSGVVDDAIAAGAPVVWAQLSVSDAAAAQKGEDAGLTVIMNNCIKVSHMNLID